MLNSPDDDAFFLFPPDPRQYPRRLKSGEEPGWTKVVNLWTRPATSVEALTVADLIDKIQGVTLEQDAASDELRADTRKFGEVVSCPPARISNGDWGAEAAFAQTEISRAASRLLAGTLYLPGKGTVGKVPLAPLRELASVGPDRRDIHDGFRVARQVTEFPAFWGHDTESVRTLAQDVNCHLIALPRAKKGRPLRDAHLLWSRAGRLMIAERLRLNTTRLVTVHLAEKALSNTWWPVAIRGGDGGRKEDTECILSLWLNSTLGILSIVAARVDTQGPWVELKKPILEGLPVLDTRALSTMQRSTLVNSYKKLARDEFCQLPVIAGDQVRAQVDATITRTLGIDANLEVLRRLVAAEPIFSCVKL